MKKYFTPSMILVTLLLLITIISSTLFEVYYPGQRQWMWPFLMGGYPWNIPGIFETSKVLGVIYIYGGYVLNLSIVYGLGIILERIYVWLSK